MDTVHKNDPVIEVTALCETFSEINDSVCQFSFPMHVHPAHLAREVNSMRERGVTLYGGVFI